eukprot:PhM_4_TR15207/c4_g1_i6/m.52463
MSTTQIVRRMISVTALLLIITNIRPATAAAPLPVVSVCILPYGDVSTLSYAFAHEIAVGKFPAYVRKQNLTNITLNVHVGYSVSALDKAEWPGAIVAWLRPRGCVLVIIPGATLTSSSLTAIRLYRNVTFMFVSQDSPTDEPNVVQFSPRYSEPDYSAGVLAALSAGVNGCIGIITAKPASTVFATVNAFGLGVQSVYPTMPMHVIALDGWNNPKLEPLAAELLLKYAGCKVMFARIDDQRDVATYVHEHRSEGARFIGYHADMRRYIGDSVLISVVHDFVGAYYRGLLAALGYRTFPRNLNYEGLKDGLQVPWSTLSAPSELVSEAHYARVLQTVDAMRHGFDPFQRDLYDTNRVLRHSGAVPFTDEDYSRINYFLNGVVRHPDAVDLDPHQCAPSTYARYAQVHGVLSLSCVRCPAGEYTAVNGSRACSVCPGDQTVVNAAQTGCDNVEEEISPTLPIVLALLCFLLLAFGMWVAWKVVLQCIQSRTAPKMNPVSFLVVEMDASDTVLSEEQRSHRTTIINLACRGGYEVTHEAETLHYLFCFATPEACIEAATMIQHEELRTCTNVVLKIAVNIGNVHIRRHWSGKVRFHGSSLQHTVEVSHLVLPGIIAATQRMYERVVGCLNEGVCRVRVRLEGQHDVRGSPVPIVLYSITPESVYHPHRPGLKGKPSEAADNGEHDLMETLRLMYPKEGLPLDVLTKALQIACPEHTVEYADVASAALILVYLQSCGIDGADLRRAAAQTIESRIELRMQWSHVATILRRLHLRTYRVSVLTRLHEVISGGRVSPMAVMQTASEEQRSAQQRRTPRSVTESASSARSDPSSKSRSSRSRQHGEPAGGSPRGGEVVPRPDVCDDNDNGQSPTSRDDYARSSPVAPGGLTVVENQNSSSFSNSDNSR